MLACNVTITRFPAYLKADLLKNTRITIMKKLFLYSFILLLSECNKYDDTVAASHLQLPPFTETGANTFGCLINGEVWANFGETYIHEELSGQLIPNVVRSGFSTNGSDSTFSISGTYTLSKLGTVLKESTLNFFVPKGPGFVGIHQFTTNNGLVNYQVAVPYNYYYSNARNPFTVTIMKDSITAGLTHIVSGTFSGTIYNYNQTDSLRIVGGVFDTSF